MDANQAYKDWSGCGYFSEHAVQDALRKYSLKKDFGGWGDPLAQMCLRGLSYLLQNTGNCVGTNQALNKLTHQCSVERIRDAFDEYSAEALEEQRESFEEDTEWFKGYYKCETLEEAEHPWGGEEVAVMKAWLALDPFEWFLFNQSVVEAGMEAIEDNIDEFVIYESDSSSYVHDSIRRVTENLMQKFAERVKGTVST